VPARGQNAKRGPWAPQVVLVIGVSGSGKTTVGRLLAEEVGWSFVDADEFYSAANRNKLTSRVPLSDEARQQWLEQLRSVISAWIEEAVPQCWPVQRSKRVLDSTWLKDWKTGSSSCISRKTSISLNGVWPVEKTIHAQGFPRESV
jgi:hypothetical protein